MWCRHCQQEVPAIATPGDGAVRCAKCHTDITLALSSRQVPPAESVASPAFREPPPFDADVWQWDDDLHEANRLVKTLGGSVANEPSTSRIDPPHRVESPAAHRPARQPRRSSFLSWAMLSLGVMAFVFGGVLLGWSFWSGRQDLWAIGLPFTLGGQAGLILGLVLQLDGLWQSNHDAATTLDDLDEQLGDLRKATALLNTSHSGPAQSFYFHLAEGASPHMLLADLKGQLDLLAMRMAKDE